MYNTITINKQALDSLKRVLIEIDIIDWIDMFETIPNHVTCIEWINDGIVWSDVWRDAYNDLPDDTEIPIYLICVANAIEKALEIENKWGFDFATKEICSEIAYALNLKIKHVNELIRLLKEGDDRITFF